MMGSMKKLRALCDTLDGRFSWVFEMKNRFSIEHKRETPKKIIEHNKYGKTAQSL